jgi:Domain of unknown function (DUF4136)
MSRFLLSSVTLLLLNEGSLAGQDIRYNFDNTTDFSKFKTYKWVALKDAAPVNAITDKQIKGALDSTFAQKGLTKVEGDNAADLLIGYQLGISTEQQFTSFNTGWSYGPGWYGGGWYGPTVELQRANINDL